MTKLTILVAGATSQVGYYVASSLLALGDTNLVVRVGTRDINSEKAEALKKLGAKVVELNPNIESSLLDSLSGVDKVFYTTSLTPLHQEHAKALAEAIKKTKTVRHVVELSREGIDLYSNLTIAKWHIEIENWIKEIPNIKYTFLRSNAFHQNMGTYFSDQIKRFSKLCSPFGDGKIASIDARDVGAVAAKILASTSSEYDNKVIALNGPESHSATDMADILSRILNKKITCEHISEEQTKELLSAFLEPGVVTAATELYSAYRRGYLARPGNEVEKILGRKAITLEQYFKDNIEKFKLEETSSS